ncbi:MAG: [Clostridia bacterium]|nr:[FeFe] hydrogenase H-cluster radical SAM maturase HydE [Clostridia bacterium]
MNKYDEKTLALIEKLWRKGKLTVSEYRQVIDGYSLVAAEYAATCAFETRKAIYDNTVFVRGLIEISNFCKNDCLYCGIRCSNKNADRYRLEKEEILECCKDGYEVGLRTFVLQGGEDGYFTDDKLVDIVSSIREKFPDCAITLSLGERSYDSYKKLFDAGANRYLLRHETADGEHYAKLHPPTLTLAKRKKCLDNLKKIGYQVGCGFMVGSPYQTDETLAKDLKLIEQFKPDMCGIGPFVPHRDTPFSQFEAGNVGLTCYLLSLIRLIHPPVLLPATTALGTVHPQGRLAAILSGANVIMPNLSPQSVRKKYELYNNKLTSGEESAQEMNKIKQQVQSIGYRVVVARGDIKK